MFSSIIYLNHCLTAQLIGRRLSHLKNHNTGVLNKYEELRRQRGRKRARFLPNHRSRHQAIFLQFLTNIPINSSFRWEKILALNFLCCNLRDIYLLFFRSSNDLFVGFSALILIHLRGHGNLLINHRI